MKSFFLLLGALASPALAQEHRHEAPGGRIGLHGMVLVGAGPYFMEHIPMLMPPHDFQIISEVKLMDGNGQEVKRDFSQGTFTLRPDRAFSLNNYITSTLRTFQGAIFEGGFEQGGRILPGLENVKVVLVEHKLLRSLPAQVSEKTFRFSDGKNDFSSNFIRPEESIQRIENLTIHKNLWCVKGPDFFEPCGSL